MHHFQAGRGKQQAERRHGVVEHPGPGQEQLDQHVVDGSARIARLVGAVALPVIVWVVDPGRLGERYERVHGRKGTRLDYPLDPLGGVLDGLLLGQAAHLQGTAAQPQRQDRVVLERLQPAVRAGQRGAGVSRQLLRAEGPAGAHHATAGQRQPLSASRAPQVQVPVGGQHPRLALLGTEQVAEDRAVGEREQAHRAARRLVRVTASTQLPLDLLGGQAWMVRLKPLGQLRRRQRPRLAELAEQAAPQPASASRRSRRYAWRASCHSRAGAVTAHPQQDRTATWLQMWMSTTANRLGGQARQGRSELPGRTATLSSRAVLEWHRLDRIPDEFLTKIGQADQCFSQDCRSVTAGPQLPCLAIQAPCTA